MELWSPPINLRVLAHGYIGSQTYPLEWMPRTFAELKDCDGCDMLHIAVDTQDEINLLRTRIYTLQYWSFSEDKWKNVREIYPNYFLTPFDDGDGIPLCDCGEKCDVDGFDECAACMLDKAADQLHIVTRERRRSAARSAVLYYM